MTEESKSTQSSGAQPREVSLNVHVSSDGMQAFLKIIQPPQVEREPEYENVLEALKSAGVTHGIDESTLRDVLLFRRYGEDIVVANGTAPVDGRDGKARFFFDPEFKVKPKEDEKGNVDFRDLGLIRSVKEGAKLAELIPPEPGTPGKNVKGAVIPPRDGKPAALPRGKNAKLHPEHPDVLIAAVNGALIYRGKNTIDIEPVFEVKGDVDFSTGNIECVGSLSVHGDVKSGFKIKAGGDVDISGVVEDAEIEAEGQVILEKGMVGRGKGSVRAKGNVYLNFCESQKIFSKADVYVGEALLHSEVVAEGKVIVSGKKGAIIGGRTVATQGLEVRNLGNYQHARTEVTVGINEETQRKLEELEEAFKKNDENVANVKKAIQVLAVQKATGKLSADKKTLLDKLRTAHSTLEGQRTAMQAQKEALEKEFEKYKGATINVIQKIFPGVHIRIQRDKIAINEERGKICYFLDVSVIGMKPLP